MKTIMSEDNNLGECVTGNLPVCAFIERSLLFKGLSKEDLDRLYQVGRLQRYQVGDLVFKEGEPGNHLILIMNGHVRVTTVGKQGEVELAKLKRGGILGEVSLLTGRPRTATVTALDEVEAIAIENQEMEALLRTYPKMRKLIQAMVEGRVRTAIEKAKE